LTLREPVGADGVFGEENDGAEEGASGGFRDGRVEGGKDVIAVRGAFAWEGRVARWEGAIGSVSTVLVSVCTSLQQSLETGGRTHRALETGVSILRHSSWSEGVCVVCVTVGRLCLMLC
jgi:hypothetical protein